MCPGQAEGLRIFGKVRPSLSRLDAKEIEEGRMIRSNANRVRRTYFGRNSAINKGTLIESVWEKGIGKARNHLGYPHENYPVVPHFSFRK